MKLMDSVFILIKLWFFFCKIYDPTANIFGADVAPLSSLERDALSVKKDDLVDLQRITLKQTSISWNDIPKLHTDDVSWHKDSRFLLTPPAISENL